MVEPLEQVSEWEQTLIEREHDICVDTGWGRGSIVSLPVSTTNLIPPQVQE